MCHHPRGATLCASDSTGPELAPKISDVQDRWWWCDAPHLCGVTSEGLWKVRTMPCSLPSGRFGLSGPPRRPRLCPANGLKVLPGDFPAANLHVSSPSFLPTTATRWVSFLRNQRPADQVPVVWPGLLLQKMSVIWLK